jgi:predicted nucleotidyltransferase
MIPDFINHKVNEIKEICENYRVNSVCIFGSSLTESFTDQSDIDLVVDFERKDFHGSFDQFMDFKTDMEGLLQRRVDLISRKTIRNEILRNEIDSSKVLIYAA